MKARLILTLAALVFLTPGKVYLSGSEDGSKIVARSLEATERDWSAQPQYDYTEQERTENGRQTWQITMIQGSPYQRLIATDGKELSKEQNAREEKKLE